MEALKGKECSDCDARATALICPTCSTEPEHRDLMSRLIRCMDCNGNPTGTTDGLCADCQSVGDKEECWYCGVVPPVLVCVCGECMRKKVAERGLVAAKGVRLDDFDAEEDGDEGEGEKQNGDEEEEGSDEGSQQASQEGSEDEGDKESEEEARKKAQEELAKTAIETGRLMLAQRHCAHCNKQGVHLFCAACHFAPTIQPDGIFVPDSSWTDQTAYCSIECLTADQQAHAMRCRSQKERLMLWRAGSILQELFYHYRYLMFDKVLLKVQTMGDGTVVLHQGVQRTIDTDMDILTPFPDDLCKEESVRAGALVYLASSDAVAWFADLVEHFMIGIATNITEHSTPLTQPALVIRSLPNNALDSTPYGHEFLQITTATAYEHYVLDLSGARFGNLAPVTMAGPYWVSRVGVSPSSIPAGQLFGTCKNALVRLAEGQRRENVITHTVRLNAVVSQSLLAATKRWEKTRKVLVRDVLAMEGEAYEGEKKNLLGFVCTALRNYLDALRRQDAERRAEIYARRNNFSPPKKVPGVFGG